MEPYNIGPRVRAACERSGMTQAEIARKAEMNWPQLWKILRGERARGVSSETLRRLALALDVSTDYLLGLRETPP